MDKTARGVWWTLAVVVAWRLALLVFTAQPVPANDSFPFDGAVIHWLQHGQYVNPSVVEAFPISGRDVFSMYPPLYQAALLPWMAVFGPTALSAMWFHFVLFCAAAALVALIVRKIFPEESLALAMLFLFAVTFDDRPEGLAHVFGLGAFLCVARAAADDRSSGRTEWLIAGLLLAALFTSVVVGAFYFGAALVTRAARRLLAPRAFRASAFVLASVSFAAIAFAIAKTHPLWWNGFLENSRQTPVRVSGFRLPPLIDILKLVRAAPVFILGLVWLLWLVPRRKAIGSALDATAGLALTLGLVAMGVLLLIASMVLLSANYVGYVLYAQVLVAAGLLAFVPRIAPETPRRFLRPMLVACVLLVSIRAVGLTTWGAICARDVGYARAQEILQTELQPFARSNQRVILSAAYLYRAAQLDLRGAVHSDWPGDRRVESLYDAIVRLRAPKLVLTQFDFYRNYAETIEQLRRHSALVKIGLRDTARVRPPDSYPALQRVLQHVSWAPVIVDLEWKT